MPRNLLVLTYEFPPSGGGGVQRIAKFCRFLPEHGWIPHVVAADPIAGRSTDESLVADVEEIRVTRVPARHVATAIASAIAPAKAVRRQVRGRFRRTASTARLGLASDSLLDKPSLSSRMARWISVPDDAVFWKHDATRAACEIARSTRAEAVLATGPPFSTLVAGARVARELDIPFIADMRDGWYTNPVIRFPTRFHRAYSVHLERGTLVAAAAATCATLSIAEEALAFGATTACVIPNGFDPADLPAHRPDANAPLRVAFMGKVYFGHADPTGFLESLARLARQDGDSRPARCIEFDLVGTWPPAIEQTVERLGLGERVRLHSYLPHREALELVSAADLGLVLVADRPGAIGTVPAKLYEYMGMGLPALLIGPANGHAADVLRQTGAGVQVDPGDDVELDAALVRFAEAKSAGRPLCRPIPGAVAEYDRRLQAVRLAGVLDRLVQS